METTLEPPGPAQRLRVGRIAAFQAVATAILSIGSSATGRGSPGSIVAGAGLLFSSLLLQHLAASLALRGGRRPAVAMGLFLLKLGLLLGIAAVGLGTSLIAPMSFASGASTLLLAIVVDACYGTGSARQTR